MKAQRSGSVDVSGMTPLRSNCIKAVKFNEHNGNLLIKFPTAIYLYFTMKKVTVTRLIKSQSPGRYFQRNISGKYRFEKVTAL